MSQFLLILIKILTETKMTLLPPLERVMSQFLRELLLLIHEKGEMVKKKPNLEVVKESDENFSLCSCAKVGMTHKAKKF